MHCCQEKKRKEPLAPWVNNQVFEGIYTSDTNSVLAL